MEKIVRKEEKGKLYLDKYYTPRSYADEVVKKTFEEIGKQNITEIVETSAGAGVFIDAIHEYLTKEELDIPIFAYDIEPDRDDIIQQDYMKLYLEYTPGRLIIGNPPFGERLQLVKRFYQKAVREGDFIAWILPAGQYKNNFSLYEFDLVYSKYLGYVEYTGVREVNSCYNIYVRPPTKTLNKRKDLDLKDVTIYTHMTGNFRQIEEYDIRMVSWGERTGEVLERDDEDYASEIKVTIHNDILRDKIENIIRGYDWSGDLKYSSTMSLSKHTIIRVLREKIPEIK